MYVYVFLVLEFQCVGIEHGVLERASSIYVFMIVYYQNYFSVSLNKPLEKSISTHNNDDIKGNHRQEIQKIIIEHQ